MNLALWPRQPVKISVCLRNGWCHGSVLISVCFVLLWSGKTSQAREQQVEEIRIKGSIALEGRSLPYVLCINFKPDAWRGMADVDREVTGIQLTIGEHQIEFPSAALQKLSGTPMPTTPLVSSEVPSQGQFNIEAGYGRKEFIAQFTFDKDRLISRTLSYSRLESADLPEERIQFKSDSAAQ